MKFPGTCIICNKKIEVNEIGLWSKGMGVKHEGCAQIKELPCNICGEPAGCRNCEFMEECNLELVSQFCICKKCFSKGDPFKAYQESTNRKFPLLKSIKT